MIPALAPATPSPDAPSPTRSPRDVLDELLPEGALVVIDVGRGDGRLVRHVAHRALAHRARARSAWTSARKPEVAVAKPETRERRP